jgi:Xaa-Pro aminopeptidase
MRGDEVFNGDFSEVQRFMREHRIDGWMLYDLNGINPIATRILGISGLQLTRRLFYWIPARGEPTALIHRIETPIVPLWPGRRLVYTGWKDLAAKLEELLDGVMRLAMEYSPMGNVPNVSFVDAGTIEFMRSFGLEVTSSSPLVVEFLCRWHEDQIASHRRVISALYAIKDEAFERVGRALDRGYPLDESNLQDFIITQLGERGLITDAGPIIAVNEHACDPHYFPEPGRSASIERGCVVLLDMWAREPGASGVYADITWMAFVGDRPPPEVDRVFRIVLRARDAGVSFIRETCKRGVFPRGYEVDRHVRKLIADQGYGRAFSHRTGHNIGAAVHGEGPNLDDLETHDDRLLVPGVCFSIEPGIYLEKFGVRSEIDVFMTPDGPEVTSPPQTDWVLIV